VNGFIDSGLLDVEDEVNDEAEECIMDELSLVMVVKPGILGIVTKQTTQIKKTVEKHINHQSTSSWRWIWRSTFPAF